MKAIRDHLPQLLDAFFEALNAKSAKQPVELSKIHGRQRFSFMEYTLSQVLMEYTMLKQVVLGELNAAGPLNYEDFFFIDKFFDNAANIAATEFALLREEELKRYADELEVSNNDLERFAAVAAHDLRAPVATIVGYADLLETMELEPQARAAVETIHRTSHRIISLVDQLLIYAKIGKSQYADKIVSLNQVVGGALENLSAQIADSQVLIEVGDLPSVHGDRVLLIQLFQNLLSNGIKFRDKGRKPHLAISCEDSDGYHVISVSDNGIGFDPATAIEIFEPFKRGDNSRRIAGSGLGLATVRKIMDLHGGSINAIGRPGEGAQFVLRFSKLRMRTSQDGAEIIEDNDELPDISRLR